MSCNRDQLSSPELCLFSRASRDSTRLVFVTKSEGISLTPQGTRTRGSEGLSIGMQKHVKLELPILLLSAQDAYEDEYVCSRNGILELDGRDTKG